MPNALAQEKSPYLLQHADNPVDWMPWGEAAFALAKAQDKPLLISIGYSTCHWCHVMERESFSDPAVAALMNENFVCVKVDREERPDIDKIYMSAVLAISGQGGWPLNCFVTPEGKPIFGGTYFPPRPAFQRPSWPQLIAGIAKAWRDPGSRLDIARQASQLAEAIQRNQEAGGQPATELPRAMLDQALVSFARTFDSDEGGFSPAPKFPMPVNQELLMTLAWWFATQGRVAESAQAATMALKTLRAMAQGGIRDHLGGGFARYSTDDRWHVPHFEKMLYDNAQLAVDYVSAYQLSGDVFFADVARETLDYMLRDLTRVDGGVYSAEDADSLPENADPLDKHAPKREGAFYAWAWSELLETLGAEDARIFGEAYGCKESGNVLQDPHAEFRGLNVLFRDISKPADHEQLAPMRQRLFDRRAKRPRPQRDEKVLAAWNGLALSAFARAATVLDETRYAAAARACADFLRKELWDESSQTLYRRWADGERAVPGHSDDYAFVVQGLLDLHQVSLRDEDLAWALRLSQLARERFFDPADGMVYMTTKDQDPLLIARVKESHDNVEPAAASIMALNHRRLWLLTGDENWRADAELSLRGHAQELERSPRALPKLTEALVLALAPPTHAVLAGDLTDSGAQALLRALRQPYRPDLVLLRSTQTLAPAFAASAGLVDQKAALYLCQDFACQLPLTDPAKVSASLLGPR